MFASKIINNKSMGRYIAHINNVYAEYGDWSWDYIKENKPKEYYDKSFIEVSLSEGKKEWTEKVKVSELVDIVKNIKTYSWKWNDKKSLHKWLFEYLKKRGDKIECIVGATLGTFELHYETPKVEGYYLQTEIGNEEIVLSLNKKFHEIKDYKDYEWIRLRLLRPYYKD